MAAVIKSGLVQLVDDVAAYFTAAGVTAAVSLGWRDRGEQINQGPGGANRIVFTPSDDSGKGGKILAPINAGQQSFGSPPAYKARALRDWERFVVVSVWGADPDDLDNEAKQIEATESLFEWLIRAVNEKAGAFAVWGDVTWEIAPEHAFGREIRVGLTLRHPMFDRPMEIVTASFVLPKPGNPEPTITTPDQALGSSSGPVAIAITANGTNFLGGGQSAFEVDGLPCTGVVVLSSDTATMTTPAIALGAHTLTVTTPGGVASHAFNVIELE